MKRIIPVLILLALLFSGCSATNTTSGGTVMTNAEVDKKMSMEVKALGDKLSGMSTSTIQADYSIKQKVTFRDTNNANPQEGTIIEVYRESYGEDKSDSWIGYTIRYYRNGSEKPSKLSVLETWLNVWGNKKQPSQVEFTYPLGSSIKAKGGIEGEVTGLHSVLDDNDVLIERYVVSSSEKSKPVIVDKEDIK